MVSLPANPKCVAAKCEAKTLSVVAPSLGTSGGDGDAAVSFADCLLGAKEAATGEPGVQQSPQTAQAMQTEPQTVQAEPHAVAVVAGQSDAKAAALEMQKAFVAPVVVANVKEKKGKEGLQGKESGKHAAHKGSAMKTDEPVAKGVVIAAPVKTQGPAAGEAGTAEPKAAVQGEVAKQNVAAVPVEAKEKGASQAKVEDVKSAAAPVATQPAAATDADHAATTPAASASDTGSVGRPASGQAAFSSVVAATVSAAAEASVGQAASTGKAGVAGGAEPRVVAVHGAERQARTIEVGALESSTPNRLEVGLRGGTLGWLNVRAEVAADGSIHTLLRGPAGTAAALTAQIGDLHRHLSEHAIEVQQITVAAVKPSAATGFDASARGDANPGAEHGGREQRREQAGSVSARQAAVPDEDEMVSVPLVSAVNSGNVLANTGGWLSVRA